MTHENLPPHLVEKLFDDRTTNKYTVLFWAGVKYIFAFVALFFFFFALINFPAYYKRIKFLINPPVVTPEKTTLESVNLTKQSEPPPTPAIPPEQDNRLTVPKLNIDVPVVWDVQFDQIVPKLADGAVHYGGTALPGQNGNVFITGHSSNFWWDKGKFNTIFATLDQLEEGDEIGLTYQGKRYKYIIEKEFVVDPSKIEVLNPTDHSIISLMTCTPVGTTINRLIVQAKQIEPLPVEASAKVGPPPLPDKLPAIR